MIEQQGRLAVYSVYDKKAQVFGVPVFFNNDAVAKRAMSQAVNDSKRSNLTDHPEDFDLFRIGSYDDLLGVLHPETPKSICVCANLKQVNQ